jgi:hypothetical protein
MEAPRPSRPGGFARRVSDTPVEIAQGPIGFVSVSPSPGGRGRWGRGEGSCPDPHWLHWARDVEFVRTGGWVRSAPGVEFVRARRPVRLGAGLRVCSGAAPSSFAPGVGFVRRPPRPPRVGERKLLYRFINEGIRDNRWWPRHEGRVRSRRRLGSFGAGIEFVRAGLRVRLVPVVEFVRARSPTGNCSTFGSFGSGEGDRRARRRRSFGSFGVLPRLPLVRFVAPS